MLATDRRLHRSADIRSTVKFGYKARHNSVMVHVYSHGVNRTIGWGSRGGVIVNKAVGNAVIRHAVARRLRHILDPVLQGCTQDVDIIIRALPAAAHVQHAVLERDVRHAVDLAHRRMLESVSRGRTGGKARGGITERNSAHER